MAKRTVEAPRSERYYQAAAYQPALLEPDPLPTFFDEKALKLARLFAGEERLAALIAHDDWVVDEDIIYEIVAVARQIAKEGFPTILVSVDEMLDIAQIFCARHPDSASRIQKFHRDRRKIAVTYPRFPKDTLELLSEQVTYPDPETAAALLVELLATLDKQDNPVWTARVAAALAYFSP